MSRRGANTILWASVICIFYGLGMTIYTKVTSGADQTGEVFFIVGLIFAWIGQVLFRMVLQMESLEHRVAKLSSRERSE